MCSSVRIQVYIIVLCPLSSKFDLYTTGSSFFHRTLILKKYEKIEFQILASHQFGTDLVTGGDGDDIFHNDGGFTS